MLDTDNIAISITTAKGLITLFWSVTFIGKKNYETCLDCFNELLGEISWANSKIEHIANKYKKYYFKHKIMTEKDAVHFDYMYSITKEPPMKKSWTTNTQSFGGYVQFSYPKEI